MTSEWHEVPLRELVGYISKGIAPSYAEEASETTIRVLNQKCNRNFRISYGDSRLHDTLKKKVPPERYVKPDDILINSTGAGTAGRIAQIEDVPSATTIDGHMILIRSNGKVTQKFLGYALKAHQWEVLQLDEGSTGQTELNRDRLLDEIMINYPVSFDEQNAIVGTLESIDRKLIVNKEINKNLMEQALTLYTTHFTTLEKNGCIGDYCSIKSGFAFKSSWWTDSGIKVIKIGSINQDNLNLLECSYVDENKINKVNDFKVRAGDLLIAMTGATIGKFAMVPYSSETLLVNQRVGKFFLGNKPVEKLPFIYCTLKQPDVYYEIVNRGQGSAQPNISGSDIMSIPCVIPSKEAIDEFNCINQPLFDLIISNQRENQQLSKIRDTILPKLMSGELDVSDIDL